MSKFITDKKDVKESIRRIIESNSMISLTDEDLGDYENIIDYQCFGLIDESFNFTYSIDEATANETKKIIVNIISIDEPTIGFIQRIISKVKIFFNKNVEIIYGEIKDKLDQNITIEILLFKKTDFIMRIYEGIH